MSLVSGTRIGPYEILTALGSGGMGEVYRARDTKLGRDVAIKILPQAFTSDADRLARFAREARVLAALNHPNIAAIYGVEDDGDVHALILELVDGETLADRLARDRVLPVATALAIARQLADALDAAHEKGIIHRDLKPGNVALTKDGIVKVLDFGLATAAVDGTASMTQSPTITFAATRSGVILGTAAYMSPEQARGQVVDKRTDIWAFGCVVYEMLSGQTAFGRSTLSDTIAAILEHEPRWEMVPGPRAIERIIRRCLEKETKARARDIADVRFELSHALDDSNATPAAAQTITSRTAWWTGVGIVALLVAAVAVMVRWLPPGSDSTAPPAASLSQLTRVTADEGVTADPAISKDGSVIAFSSDRAGRDDLDIWIQRTGSAAAIRLTDDDVDEHEPAVSPDGGLIAFRSERGTGGLYVIPTFGGEQPRLLVEGGRRPRFSPDGRSIAYWAGNDIGFSPRVDSYRAFVIDRSGGTPREIGAKMTGVRYPLWSPDGTGILATASQASSPVLASFDWWLFPTADGAAVPVNVREMFRQAGINANRNTLWPEAWTDEAVLFSDFRSIWSIGIDSRTGAVTRALQRLTLGTSNEAQPTVSANGTIAFTSFTQPGHVWAVPLDADRGLATGAPKQITTGAGVETRPSASADGKLVLYRSTTLRPTIQLRNLDTGRVTDAGVSGSDFGPALSPDGRWIAFESGSGVSVMPAQGGPARSLCTDCTIGDWTSTSTSLIVIRASKGFAMVDVASGMMRDLMVSTEELSRPFLSPDGRMLTFRVSRNSRDAVMVAPVDPSGSVSEANWKPVVREEEDARPCGWSPNSRLLYFVSARDGTRCLYAQRLNQRTGEPEGESIAVRHFHGTRNIWANSGGVLSTGPANAIRGGFFFYDVAAFTANIWTMANSPSKDAQP